MTWTNETKSTATWSNLSGSGMSSVDRLLMEDGSFLLLETLDKILLESSSSSTTPWTNLAKN